jgi:pimeloyl-ACP methyl ester carboxylesterase
MAMDLAIREADRVKIRFAEAGQGESETVVDEPMAGECARLPKGYGTGLAEWFHLVAIDLPGFGQSERQLDLLSPFATLGDALLHQTRCSR